MIIALPRLNQPASAGRSIGHRRGATLIEVLMSLLIMGIGVTSVISIFPISMLRSIQASQLTNSRMMRHNTEQLFGMPLQDGRLLATSPADPPPHLFTPFVTTTQPVPFEYRVLDQHTLRDPQYLNQVFRGIWQPETYYALGQIVCSTCREGELNPARNRWFVCIDAAGNPGAYSRAVEPNWNLTAYVVPIGTADDLTYEGLLTWECLTVNPFGEPKQPIQVPVLVGPNFDALNYVVDPLGWNVFLDESSDILAAPELANQFGFKVDGTGFATPAPYTAGDPRTWPLLRVNGGAAFTQEARSIASHPDSWTTGTSSILDAFTATSATFPATVDLSDVRIGDRIVLTSVQNNASVMRNISGATPPLTLGWLEPLPVNFVADGVARIEKFNPLYTWIATVNKDLEGSAKVTIAVISKRGFLPAEEHLYYANLGNDGTLPTPFVTPSVPVAADQIRIQWDPMAEPDPLIRPGNYLLDASCARWYRIVTASVGSGTATITVDRPIPVSQRTVDPDTVAGRVILMRGIVDLFEL